MNTALVAGDNLGNQRVVCFTPTSGLLTQEKYVPIRYCLLQVELELVTSADEAFSAALTARGNQAVPAFTLSDIQFKVDLVTLDNSLDDEYAQHLLSGNPYPLILAPLQLLHKLLPILPQPSMYHVR